jgi:HSP20 family protein
MSTPRPRRECDKEVPLMLPTLWRESEKLPLFGLRSEIDRLFDDFFTERNGHGWMERMGKSVKPFAPVVDVKETDESIVVEAELPGLQASEVDVQVVDRMLFLRGERKQHKEEKTKQWHRTERWWGKFERQIALPDYADVEKVDAACKDGVLTVTIPKKAGARSKTVSIKVK